MNEVDEIRAAGPKVARIPKGMLFPVNPAGPIVLPVTTLDGDAYTLHIGGVSSMGGSPDQLCPALCFRHFRVLLKLIQRGNSNSSTIPVQYSDFLSSDGNNVRKALRKTLNELRRTWFHKVRGRSVDSLQLLQYNPEIYYRDGVDTENADEREKEENIEYRVLREVTLHEDFFRALINWSQCWKVLPEVVDSMWSDNAAAAYMLLVPAAHNPEVSEANPSLRDAAKLLRALGLPVPKYLSQLRQVFERPGRSSGGMSLLKQLNGKRTFGGRLRVEEQLRVNAAGNGFNVVSWAETSAQGQSWEQDGKLMEIWRNLGRTHADFVALQKPSCRALLPYEIEQLKELGYPVDKDRRYLELVRSFVGTIAFDCAIGEAQAAKRKVESQESGQGGIDDMGKFIGGLMRREFQEWAVGDSKKAAGLTNASVPDQRLRGLTNA